MVKRVPDLVSIVITAYNRENYLIECLDSLLNQTYRNIELIIVDDASTDNTQVVIKNWKIKNQKNPITNNMVVAQLPRNIGFAGALNVGYYLAKGEYIAVQDSDDLSHSERIEKQVAFMKENPNIGLVGTSFAAFRNPQKLQNAFEAVWLTFGSENIKKKYDQKQHCVCHGTLLFRGEIFDKYGGPTRRLHGAEDFEFIERCHLENIENLKEVLYYYRIHPSNRSNEFYNDKN